MKSKDVMNMNIINSAAYRNSIRNRTNRSDVTRQKSVRNDDIRNQAARDQETQSDAAWYDISRNGIGDKTNEQKQQDSDTKKVESPVSLELSEKGRQMAKLADAFRNKNMKRMSNSGKKKKKSTGDLSRALAIARRIMKGEKVPPKDESFLFRYNSDLYLKAKMMATIQANPKKHKSLLDEMEEEEGSGNAHTVSAPSAPEPETPESSPDSENGSESSS